MKIIKFRRYKIRLNKMVYQDELKQELGVNYLDEAIGYSKPMQFTGLLDKQGKEIYEGDIIKTYVDDLLFEIKYMLAEYVLWPLNIKPKIVYLLKECFSIKNGVADKTFIEVIGNIYENSELVKEE